MKNQKERTAQTSEAIMALRFAIEKFVETVYEQRLDVDMETGVSRKTSEESVAYLQRDVQQFVAGMKRNELKVSSYRRLVMMMSRLTLLKDQMDDALIVVGKRRDMVKGLEGGVKSAD